MDSTASSSRPPSPQSDSPPHAQPVARELGAVNWRGLWTLYAKEVRRFLNVSTQTILAPVVTSLLFLAIFTLALGRTVPSLGSVSFAEFLARRQRRAS